jgi:hypothetical protein
MKLRLAILVAAAAQITGCQGLLNLSMVPATIGAPATAVFGAINPHSYPEEGRDITGAPTLAARGAPLGTYGMTMVGHYTTYNEVFIGEVARNLSTDAEEVFLELRNTAASCSGELYAPDDGWPKEWPLGMRNCLSRTARGVLKCSDGRELELEWRSPECRVAYGTGYDKSGGMLRFTVGLKSDEALSQYDRLAVQLTPYPGLPAYSPN